MALNRCQDALEESRNRQAMLAQRRAELEIARQQLADTAVHAPLPDDPGTARQLGSMRHRWLSGRHSGQDGPAAAPAGSLGTGCGRHSRRAKVRLHVEGDTNTYTGEIKRLSPTLNEQNRILLVEADVPNPGALRPGAFVRAEIITDENRKAVLVPAGTVVTFAGIEKVFLVQNGKAMEKPVAIGRRMASGLEVLTGVKAGDWVVVDPGNLQSGQMVTPKP